MTETTVHFYRLFWKKQTVLLSVIVICGKRGFVMISNYLASSFAKNISTLKMPNGLEDSY